MTNEASPRPWRVGENSLGWKSCIEDADGKQIASCWGGDGVNCTEQAQSDAALIVDAVNTLAEFEAARMEFPDFRPVIIAAGQRDAAIAERDRLRDLVRRLVRVAIRDRETLRYIYSDVEYATEDDDAIGDALREARAAIGEDRP